MLAPPQITSDDRTWFAVQATPLKERLAIRHLLHQGLDVFWLHYLAAVKIGSHRGYAYRSWLPPAWLFVADDAEPGTVTLIRKSMGILDVLHAGDIPLKLSGDDLLGLRAIADPAGLVPRCRPRILAPKNMVEISGRNFLNILHELNPLKLHATTS